METLNPAKLDIPETYKTLDPQAMVDRIHEFPAQCQRAWDMAMKFDLPRDFSRADRVAVLGMGGSAIGGDLLSALVISESRVPVLTIRGYTLPVYADENTLVVASSYSGNTEETLACFEQSLKAGAMMVAITTGGKLEAAARRNNVPVFTFDYDAQPRAALPFSFFPLLCFLQKLGFVSDKSGDVREALDVLGRLSATLNESVPVSDNLAKRLARDLSGHLAVIYGAGIMSEVAHRWKTQINENGKAWAFYEAFPELNHNAVVGFRFPVELASRVLVLMLSSPDLPERIKLRYRVTARILKDAGVDYHLIDASGSTELSRMMGLVLLGDYVSYYLAILYGTDPTPVHPIDYLKNELARG